MSIEYIFSIISQLLIQLTYCVTDQIFGIKHYAGDVYYLIHSFIEKNRDSTSVDVKEIMATSSNTILSKIIEESIACSINNNNISIGYSSSSSNNSFASPIQKPTYNSVSSTNLLLPNSSQKMGSGAAVMSGKMSSLTGPGGNSLSASASTTSNNNVSKLKEDSISKQFTSSLKLLYDILDSTEPHYIRCVKPNVHKESDRLHGRQCLDQLRCAGNYLLKLIL